MIDKCKRCGSIKFDVYETVVHPADLVVEMVQGVPTPIIQIQEKASEAWTGRVVCSGCALLFTDLQDKENEIDWEYID